MKMVALESVSKSFQRRGFLSCALNEETHALNRVSLEVAAGEVVGLLGPNGSGKSTTLKLVSTVLVPDEGRVLVAGMDISRSGQAVRRRVGFALASERSFFPRLTARENLEFFSALEDVPWRECRARAESTLRNVELHEAAEKQVMRLSSGMYQRLAVARALLKKPSVLLLDEPSRSLDAAAASHLWKLIRELAGTGIAILIATHNFAEAIEVCDRVAILERGVLRDVVETVGFNENQLRNFYLELIGHHEQRSWSEEVPV